MALRNLISKRSFRFLEKVWDGLPRNRLALRLRGR